MLYSGPAFSATALGDGLVELKFDLAGESVNKLSQAALRDFDAATQAIAQDASVKGVIVTSGKSVFIVGADVTEFGAMFAAGEEAVAKGVLEVNKLLCRFEDLPVPTVAAINGICLGGGLELALGCDYRVMSTAASVGFPEVKLGIFPGFGGSVRLPRVIGVDNAIEWICTGADKKPDAALKDGAVDAVVAPEALRDAALAMLKQAIAGRLDWKAKRAEKLVPVKLNPMESMMAFTSAMGFVAGKAGPNYPAPMLAIRSIQESSTKGRDDAIAIEAKYFAKAAATPQANALVGLFMADQAVKKAAGAWAKKGSKEMKQAAVLGAGIMGGGIAYQSAVKGTPIIMKDIRAEALDLGMNEAGKLLAKQVEKGRSTPEKMSQTLSRIRPTLNYGDFNDVDIIIEAVVENPKVKKAVFAEVEGLVRDDTIIASNTSTISITSLAEGLKRPQNFVGMHFFNPVQMMPLVEVIRGKKSSDAAIAATVALALTMGKTPIVVNDCPGFMVNRVLFPYFAGFHMLLRDGRDFLAVDKVDGEVRLADGPGIPDGRRWHGHGGPRCGRHGRGLPGSNEARLQGNDATSWSSTSGWARNRARAITAMSPTRRASRRRAADPETYELIKGVVAATQASSRPRKSSTRMHGAAGHRGARAASKTASLPRRPRRTWR